MIYYYKVLSNEGDELSVIGKTENDITLFEDIITDPPYFRMDPKLDKRICKELGTDDWWWDIITQAEFGTYQSFGIKEI